MRIRVSVPASAGNTGSAFDCLGIAFDLYNEITADTDGCGVEGAEGIRRNLVLEAMDRFAQATGRPVPRAKISQINRIPVCRGLGSSAAAIVGGLVLANTLTEARLTPEQLLEIGLTMEDHPDNLAPALFGGAVLTVMKPLTVLPLRVPPDWRAVLYVPDVEIPTSHARAILPPQVPRADAIHNHSRVGLLVAAFLLNRPELLRVAMQDRLHQPYRAKIFPPQDPLIAAALEGGAWGACLSGAGSAVLALAHTSKSDRVARAMTEQAQRLNCPGRSLVLTISATGVHVEPAP